MAQRKNPELSGRQALRPQARPVNQEYRVAPEPVAQDNSAARLVESLSRLQPQLVHTYARQQQIEQKEQEQKAADFFQGLTPEEADKMVKSGQIDEYQNPWFQAAFYKLYGAQYARQLGTQLPAEWEQSYPQDGSVDINQWLGERRQVALSALPNEFARSGFNESIGRFENQIVNMQTQHTRSVVREKKLDAAYSHLAGIVEQGREQGLSEEEIHQNIRGQYGQLNQMMNISRKEAVDLTMRLAEDAASQGDVALFSALVDGDRKDDNGKSIGALSKVLRHKDKITELRAKADRVAQNNWEEENEDRIVSYTQMAHRGELVGDAREEYDAWVEQNDKFISGGFKSRMITAIETGIERRRKQAEKALKEQAKSSILSSAVQEMIVRGTKQEGDYLGTLPDGEVFSVSEQEVNNRLKLSLNRQLQKQLETELAQVNQIPDEAKREEASRAVIADHMRKTFEAYAERGLKHDQWFSDMKVGAAGANWLNGEGELNPAVARGYELYRNLNAWGPDYVAAHLPEGVREKYDLLDTAIQYGGWSLEEAARQLQMAREEKPDGNQLRRQSQAVEQKLHSDDSIAPVRGRMKKLALFYLRSIPGMDEDTAYEKAKEKIEQNLVELDNGLKLDALYIPPGERDLFTDFVNDKLTKIAETSDEYTSFWSDTVFEDQSDVDDLMVLHQGNGVYRIVRRDGQQLLNAEGEAVDHVFSYRDFQQAHLQSIADEIKDSATDALLSQSPTKYPFPSAM